MPDESEVVQSDVFVEFPLPNGKTLPGKPVPYPVARKIMALLHAFDQTLDYEKHLFLAMDQFTAASGLTDAEIMAACPDMTLGELTTAIQRFFFRRRPTLASGAASPTPAPGA